MCVTPNPHAKELGIATVGDTDRYGKFMVTRTYWDTNGTLFVTMEENTGEAVSVYELLSRDLERARALARRCLIYPEKTRSSKVSGHKYDNGRLNLTFAVSRNS